ncbi:MAG: ion transporter [Bacteroidota bacterium]|nr:ion transporter [Bacteroidota bacterium]MEC8033144.1 ion transporter [Bacteroidota bacterium]
MKSTLKALVANRLFESAIIGVILINSVLIGVETYFTNSTITSIQLLCLVIFTVEVVLRMAASDTAKEYFSDGWNVFDFTIVAISFVPESMFENAQMVSAIRVLRVFRVLRLLRTSEEIKLIVSVLARSFRSLFYNAIFFSIFLYLYAVIGVTLFKLPDYNSAQPALQAKLDTYAQLAPNAPVVSPDPYGTLDETMFTLFRILTGEDWTDLKYNLDKAAELEIIPTTKLVVNAYHVSWFILSAFLLLNLVVGAILNNYQVIMEETKAQKEKQPSNG